METKINYENRTEKTPADASLICCSVREPINSMSLETNRNPVENSKFFFHCGSEYNLLNKEAVCNRVFVLGFDGKPLTPCRPKRARLEEKFIHTLTYKLRNMAFFLKNIQLNKIRSKNEI